MVLNVVQHTKYCDFSGLCFFFEIVLLSFPRHVTFSFCLFLSHVVVCLCCKSSVFVYFTHHFNYSFRFLSTKYKLKRDVMHWPRESTIEFSIGSSHVLIHAWRKEVCFLFFTNKINLCSTHSKLKIQLFSFSFQKIREWSLYRSLGYLRI
jgi:hypothetical protein